MRLLEFTTNNRQLKKSPTCDFSEITRGNGGQLAAKFEFSREWDGYRKAASFWVDGVEHAAALADGFCIVPSEALGGRLFSVTVTGARGGHRMTTNRVIVRLEGF